MHVFSYLDYSGRLSGEEHPRAAYKAQQGIKQEMNAFEVATDRITAPSANTNHDSH